MIITITYMSNDDTDDLKQRVIKPGFTPHDSNWFRAWVGTGEVSLEDLRKVCILIQKIDNFSIYSYARDTVTSEKVWVMVDDNINKPVMVGIIDCSTERPLLRHLKCVDDVIDEFDIFDRFNESLNDSFNRADRNPLLAN